MNPSSRHEVHHRFGYRFGILNAFFTLLGESDGLLADFEFELRKQVFLQHQVDQLGGMGFFPSSEHPEFGKPLESQSDDRFAGRSSEVLA